VKIVHLVPGSGGTFYCENCLRDTSVVDGLRRRGHDVVMVPLYLPLFGHDPSHAGDAPIFFGGINTWLQEHLPLFRHTPRWVDRFFDSEALLKAAAGRAGSTSPKSLGPMTVSMLRGEEGHQAKELERLAEWLAATVAPEVVHISNALLLGLARRIKESTGAVVVCSLQDEAPWVDAMDPPWPERVWSEISDRAGDVDLFLSVSQWYAGVAARRIGLRSEDIRVVPIGIDAAAYLPPHPATDPPVLGYMARESVGEGLGLLAEAWFRLRQKGHPALKLKVTGGRTAEDLPLHRRVKKLADDAGAAGDLEFVDDFTWESRRRFLSTLTLFSVPGTAQAAFGLHVLEALAAGVPVVQPKAGAFPELIAATGGGVLFEPGDLDSLVTGLDGLLRDPDRARGLGDRGRAGAREHYHLEKMSDRFVALYEEVAGGK